MAHNTFGVNCLYTGAAEVTPTFKGQYMHTVGVISAAPVYAFYNISLFKIEI
jgi:hypothetical protein